jgi:hypothetical protein
MDITPRVNVLFRKVKALNDEMDEAILRSEDTTTPFIILGMKSVVVDEFVKIYEALESKDKVSAAHTQFLLSRIENRMKVYRDQWEKYKAGGK